MISVTSQPIPIGKPSYQPQILGDLMLKAKERINANLERRSGLPAMHVASKNPSAMLTLTSPNRAQDAGNKILTVLF
jgi:hypothetical protein